MINKKGQVTIFIIIAVVILAIAGLYFTFGKNILNSPIPESIAPVYNSFINCMQKTTLDGVALLGTHGGYIYLPDFEKGSTYMPFSSQLDFMGSPIPYWYYVSENNIPKEQVPTKSEMEAQLARYVSENIYSCNLDNYYSQGFLIAYNNPEVFVNINSNFIDVSMDMPLSIENEDESYSLNDHKFKIDSYLGKLYSNAIEIYNQEQSEMILEKYGVDILRLYAPVEGVEFTCFPKIWNADEVFQTLSLAIQDNTLALTTKNGPKSLDDETDYFVTDFDFNSDIYVRFINFNTWPHSYEVDPNSGNLLISDPVGNQAGLGMLGFCYNHYHFIYDIKYPVLIQLSRDDEVFQFPFPVIIQGNVPREPINSTSIDILDLGLCENKNIPVSIDVYDDFLNKVNASISYQCSTENCFIGYAPLSENFPPCSNGEIIVNADGFKEKRKIFSTVNPGSAQIFLEKEYDLIVNLNLGGSSYDGEAVIYVNSNDGISKTLFYPQQRMISLAEGDYNFSVSYYSNSSIEFEGGVTEQCIDVSRGGVLGLFGATKEECFELEFEDQIISKALVGGGSFEGHFSENDLKNSNTLYINSAPLLTPTKIEDIQINYILFEEQKIGVELR